MAQEPATPCGAANPASPGGRRCIGVAGKDIGSVGLLSDQAVNTLAHLCFLMFGDGEAASASPHFSHGQLLFDEGEVDRRKTIRTVAPKALIAIWF